MTPRELRKLLGTGELVKAGRLPEPPVEWSPMRQDRLRIAIHAAALFLFRHANWDQIKALLVSKHNRSENLTRQRIQQYVVRGCEYMITVGTIKKEG